jgi:hypothetical protein
MGGTDFKTEKRGGLLGAYKLSLAAIIYYCSLNFLPEAEIKSLSVGFPKLGFSLAGCQNFWMCTCLCDYCSLLFSVANVLSNACFCF